MRHLGPGVLWRKADLPTLAAPGGRGPLSALAGLPSRLDLGCDLGSISRREGRGPCRAARRGVRGPPPAGGRGEAAQAKEGRVARVRVVAAGCVAEAGWCVSVGWCVAVRPSLPAGLQPVARLRRDEVHVDDAADLARRAAEPVRHPLRLRTARQQVELRAWGKAPDGFREGSSRGSSGHVSSRRSARSGFRPRARARAGAACLQAMAEAQGVGSIQAAPRPPSEHCSQSSASTSVCQPRRSSRRGER